MWLSQRGGWEKRKDKKRKEAASMKTRGGEEMTREEKEDKSETEV